MRGGYRSRDTHEHPGRWNLGGDPQGHTHWHVRLHMAGHAKVAKLREDASTSESNFDQCRTGLDTVKPTKFLVHKLAFDELNGLRCNHPSKKFKRADGTEYWAAHESALQRWVTGPTGKLERASRSQGEYTDPVRDPSQGNSQNCSRRLAPEGAGEGATSLSRG